MKNIKAAITLGAYNEENNIGKFLDAALRQTYMPSEIIIVDDGSTDKTAEIVKKYAASHPIIKYIYQKNSGPACARNNAWKNSNADVCVFTDGDCVPKENWIEELIKPLEDDSVAAAGGGYETINKDKILARFIGYEIDYRYRNIGKEITAHGTYNLAVKKNVLKEVGGFDEKYKRPSGEDWDLTYRISQKYKIIFVRSAIVGHNHPEKFWPYMKNQYFRGLDRIRVYKDHPKKINGDNYTPSIIKFQVAASLALIPCLVLIYPFSKFSYLIPLFIFLFLLASSLISFPYFFKKDALTAIYSIPVQLCRNYAWALGAVAGVLYFSNTSAGKMPNENGWDTFWDAKRSSRFTKKSWSKIRMMKLLDQVTKEGMTVLDVGCGSGFFSNYFISKGCKVYAMDYSLEALKIAKEITHNKAEAYLQDDIFNLDFVQKYNKKFDILFSDGLLEHFSDEDQKKIVNNLKALKKTDGVIATFVPNKYSWWEIIRPIFMPGINERPFTMKKLKQLFTGMKTVKSGGINVIPLAISPDRLAGSYIGMILYIFSS